MLVRNAAIFAILIAAAMLISGCVQLPPATTPTPSPTASALPTATPTTPADYGQCSADADCVPAQCCHATDAINKKYAPDCRGVMCTMVCSGPLDCGAGWIACINNKCTIVSASNVSTVYLGEGQRDGPLLVQKIYPDRVEGLAFVEYPVPRDQGRPITLRIGESASNGCTVTLTLAKISGNAAEFSKKVESGKPCPICLSGDTRIGTPNGDALVKDLHEGMAIWTEDASGRRRAATILETGKTAVPPWHVMVHIVLSDGRELYASPGHQLADGRAMGSIAKGDSVDNATVTASERVPYGKPYTYDILPSGDTGVYWANGIPVRSTLAR